MNSAGNHRAAQWATFGRLAIELFSVFPGVVRGSWTASRATGGTIASSLTLHSDGTVAHESAVIGGIACRIENNRRGDGSYPYLWSYTYTAEQGRQDVPGRTLIGHFIPQLTIAPADRGCARLHLCAIGNNQQYGCL